MKLNPISLQMRSSTDESVIIEQEDTPTSVFMKYLYLCTDAHESSVENCPLFYSLGKSMLEVYRKTP
jgi:hypothetical protein